MWKPIDQLSNEEAESEVNSLVGNPESPYWKTGWQHKETVDRVSKLYGKIHPENQDHKNLSPDNQAMAERLEKAGVTKDTIDKADTAEDYLAGKSREKAEKTLRDELGDEYEAKVTAAREMVKRYGSPDDVRALTEGPEGNNVELIKHLAAIAAILKG